MNEWILVHLFESFRYIVVKVKVTQSCPTLGNPMDYTVRGILQTRILEWESFPFSRGPSQPRGQTQVSCIAGGFFTSHNISSKCLKFTSSLEVFIPQLYSNNMSEKSLSSLIHLFKKLCSRHYLKCQRYRNEPKKEKK